MCIMVSFTFPSSKNDSRIVLDFRRLWQNCISLTSYSGCNLCEHCRPHLYISSRCTHNRQCEHSLNMNKWFFRAIPYLRYLDIWFHMISCTTGVISYIRVFLWFDDGWGWKLKHALRFQSGLMIEGAEHSIAHYGFCMVFIRWYWTLHHALWILYDFMMEGAEHSIMRYVKLWQFGWLAFCFDHVRWKWTLVIWTKIPEWIMYLWDM